MAFLGVYCEILKLGLSSMLGRGTTAHAVLALNKEDGGNRKFILVECEDYADTITAERVRRVIFTEKLRIDGKNLLRIEVPRSLFVHKTSNGYFIRQGSSKREMPTEQLARLFQSRSQARIIAFDEQFVPNTDKDTLKSDLYERFITEGAAADEVEDLLLKRHLLVKEDQQNRASVAGVLMCHEKPDDYLYNSFIQAVFYRGQHKDANYQIDAKDFKGPLDQQIIDTMRFVYRYNAVAARKDIGRIDFPEYSMRAVFEAVVNAVVHRDYSKTGSKVRHLKILRR